MELRWSLRDFIIENVFTTHKFGVQRGQMCLVKREILEVRRREAQWRGVRRRGRPAKKWKNKPLHQKMKK